jgi:signal transduction histidine kinase
MLLNPIFGAARDLACVKPDVRESVISRIVTLAPESEMRGTVLHDMLTARREELLGAASSVSGTDVQRLGPFLDQIVAALRKEAGIVEDGVDLNAPSERYGRERSRERAPVGDVVHEFGSLCTAIMTMVGKEQAKISPREYQTLNESLDTGIAQAVTEFAANQEADRQQDATQQLGVVTHELRNALHAASISFRAIRDGQVPAAGRTAEVVDRSHRRLRSLIARLVATVRMRTGLPLRRQPIPIRGILQECIDMIALDAQDRDLRIASEIAQPATVDGDADMLHLSEGARVDRAGRFLRGACAGRGVVDVRAVHAARNGSQRSRTRPRASAPDRRRARRLDLGSRPAWQGVCVHRRAAAPARIGRSVNVLRKSR